ncbi:mitochondrial import inner membrane translocase subunit Tim21-like [Amphiura filiformis]|uniref:mitochondrial import inner membrane translocase subunit Tim21-like n=1 Tax=Amphiura filiformis TaxID=82378 RepID=UPI003B20C17D
MSLGLQLPTSLLPRLLSSQQSSCIVNTSLTKTSWLRLCMRQTGTSCRQVSTLNERAWETRCCRSRNISTTSSLKARDKQITKQTVKDGKGQLTVGAKVAQAGKDTMYTGIIIVGVGVTGLMFYTVFKELFSSNSPNGVYTKALKICLQDGEIIEELGEPIKGYGEETRRRRRRHVSHLDYTDQDGVRHMRMKFYMKGTKRRATVHLEVKANESGKFEYRYLFAELDGYPQKTIILEDNR